MWASATAGFRKMSRFVPVTRDGERISSYCHPVPVSVNVTPVGKRSYGNRSDHGIAAGLLVDRAGVDHGDGNRIKHAAGPQVANMRSNGMVWSGITTCARSSLGLISRWFRSSLQRNEGDHPIAQDFGLPQSIHDTMPTRVLLADDHVLVRQGLKAFLERHEFQVISEASDGQEAVRMAAKTHPDVAILDISMPILNGVDAARELKKSSPKTRVIFLTKHDEDQYVTEAIRVGVRGYVLKSQAANDLVRAIQEVRRGRVYLSPSISPVGAMARAPSDPLTARERQVLHLVGEGKSTKQVAAHLGISVKTVESHRTRLMRKIHIHGTAGLVRYAIRRGLIQP